MPQNDALDPIAYYNPEVYHSRNSPTALPRPVTSTTAALYLILDWKAPRARTRHLRRLANLAGGSFSAAARGIAGDIRAAEEPEARMRALLTKWGFRLPTASAILAVLYPDKFTVYDIRVCDVLGDFRALGDRTWSAETWREYQRFVDAVHSTKVPTELTTLRV